MEILENVWDIDFNLGTNVVDVYVNYLRKKIDKNRESKLIHTMIGMGYMMKEESVMNIRNKITTLFTVLTGGNYPDAEYFYLSLL